MTKEQIKTPSNLKAFHDADGSFFFTRSTMKFFGDTMRNYGLRRVKLETIHGVVDAFELYRRRPVGQFNNRDSAFFSCEQPSKRVFPLRDNNNG